jgi:hypothetical protein
MFDQNVRKNICSLAEVYIKRYQRIPIIAYSLGEQRNHRPVFRILYSAMNIPDGVARRLFDHEDTGGDFDMEVGTNLTKVGVDDPVAFTGFEIGANADDINLTLPLQ